MKILYPLYAVWEEIYKRRSEFLKKRRIIIFFVMLALFLFAVAALIIFNFCNIKKITVIGNEKYSENEIIELSGLKINDNLLRIDNEQAAKNIEDINDLVCKGIKIIFPDTVEIRIYERKNAFTVAYNNNYIIIDREGYILSVSGTLPEYPIVSGFAVSGFSVGQLIVKEDDFRRSVMENIYNTLEDFTIKREIAELDLANINSIKLITKSGLIIKLGQADKIYEKLQFATAVYDDLASSGIERGTIDVSTGDSGVYSPEIITVPDDQTSQDALPEAGNEPDGEPEPT